MEKTPNGSKAEVIIRMFPSDANPAGMSLAVQS